MSGQCAAKPRRDVEPLLEGDGFNTKAATRNRAEADQPFDLF